MTFIAYYRVSTDKQGDRGYGLDAQRKAVADYLAGAELMAEFTEVESGKRHENRPELQAALAAAKKHKAKLVIAKLDRLARNVAFIASLMEEGVDFVCCDMPSATPFMLHIYAAVAQEERRMIAIRTKAGLAAAKARGVKLGNRQQAKANRDKAIAHARRLAPMLEETAALSSREAAAAFNDRRLRAPKGGLWSYQTVLRMRERLTVSADAAQRGV